MSCCRTRRRVANPKTEQKAEDDEELAPSVFHLKSSFLEEIQIAGLEETVTINDLANLRLETPGIILSKGKSMKCPRDGRIGASYVDCLEGVDHVGNATHMLSYSGDYQYSDLVDVLNIFCLNQGLDVKRTYVWICAFCLNQHRVAEQAPGFQDNNEKLQKTMKDIGNTILMISSWRCLVNLERSPNVIDSHIIDGDTVGAIHPVTSTRESIVFIDGVINATEQEDENMLKVGLT